MSDSEVRKKKFEELVHYAESKLELNPVEILTFAAIMIQTFADITRQPTEEVLGEVRKYLQEIQRRRNPAIT